MEQSRGALTKVGKKLKIKQKIKTKRKILMGFLSQNLHIIFSHFFLQICRAFIYNIYKCDKLNSLA